ncbi:conserved hypothetical protein [Gammaproteobacteria bacterium]
MGLFINLTAQLNRIEPLDWEAAYRDSLVLLQHFPATLVRHDSQKVGGHRRYFSTDKIIRDPSGEDECWSISGDRDSGRDAEEFSLHRYIHRQPGYDSAKTPDVDVLWAGEKAIDYRDGGRGINLFGNKTQGYPYHLALLAVAALFEHRFPGRCFVFGDIDQESARQVVRWVNAVLPAEPVAIGVPVCFDGPSLYRRLASLYDDQKLVTKRFKTLFHGSEEETLHVLLAHAERDGLCQSLAEDLNSYQSLFQRGATSILSSYLSATQDLEVVIDLVLTANRSRTQPEFLLEDLLKVLCQGFVTLDFPERAPLSVLSRPVERMATIEETFSQIFMSLAGAPLDMGFYINRIALLEAFAARAPDRREHFLDIIHTEENHCRKKLAKIADVAGQRSGETPTTALLEDGAETTAQVLCKDDAAHHPENDLPGVSYILRQIDEQREEFPYGERAIEVIGQGVNRIIQKDQDTFGSTDQAHYLDLIGWAGEKQGIGLWHEAWKEIDKESDLEILKSLTALFMISEREINFWHTRIHILEHKTLWPRLLNQSTLIHTPDSLPSRN